MTPSLANATFIDGMPRIPLNEPENPKEIDVIEWKRTDEGIEALYYREGSLHESFDQVSKDELFEWAVKHNYIFQVYELPFYDHENDEEYMVIHPCTSESGTAEEINANRLNRFIHDMNEWTVEQILKSIVRV